MGMMLRTPPCGAGMTSSPLKLERLADFFSGAAAAVDASSWAELFIMSLSFAEMSATVCSLVVAAAAFLAMCSSVMPVYTAQA